MGRSDSAHPRSEAGILGRLFFSWLFPIFLRGKNKDLQTKDLYQVLPENLSEPVTNKLESHWKNECDDAHEKKCKPSFVRAIKRTFKWNFLLYGLHYFFSSLVLAVLQPVTMGKLISHFEEPSKSSITKACAYAGAFCIVSFLNRMTFWHLLFGLRSLGISTRVACASLVYRKMIKLSHSAKVTRGKIMNLLSNDMAKLEICFIFMHTLWILPLQTVLITYLIWTHVGVASIFGVFVLALQTVPVQSYCGKVIASLRKKIGAKTDERVLLTGGIVRGIRVIKMYAWEKPFEQLMFLARRYEINIIAKAFYLKSTLWAVMASAQRTPLFVTVVIYVFQGYSMSAYTMFSLVQYFNIMHVTMGSYFFRAVYTLSEALGSAKRVQDFLLLDEQETSSKGTLNHGDTIVYISEVSVSSNEKPEVNFLHDISLSVRRNLLYAVVGPVGSGKSSLLKLILRELGPIVGQVNVSGDISYSSQEPWLFKGSIRNNIIFNEAYDKNKYDQVTRACALEEDFSQLSNGDQTDVEENGMNLSGGQCARISLARAVYRNSDIYLLDDPLSAVDSRVGKHLFDECINGLLKNKTRILVTHQLQYLKQSDEIILIDNGRVEYQGDFANLQKNDELFQHLNFSETEKAAEIIKKSSSKSLNIADEDEETEPIETEKLLNGEKVSENMDEKKLSAEKNKLSPLSVYWKYFTCGSSHVLPYATLLAFVGAQLAYSGCDYFVAYWTKKQSYIIMNRNSTNPTDLEITKLSAAHLDSNTALWIFGIFIVSILIISVIKMVCYTTTCKNSNERIHNMMAASLLKTSMSFFEKNDSGKILNRFTKDLGFSDELLQATMLEAGEYVFIMIGVSVQIIMINHWFIVIVLLSIFIIWKSRVYVIRATRDMMRLEAQAKSPVFSHANSSYTGRAIIRCSQAQDLACQEFDAYQDNHTQAASLIHYSLVAYNFGLDVVTGIFTVLVTYSFILHGGASGANVGLAITQILMLTGILARGIKLTADIETMMVSVERLLEYTELESEDERGQSPPSFWPSSGKIRFDSVSLRYSENSPYVLNNVDFTIEAGAKIGIVGRSGAGKSSLMAALFRLTKIEGNIFVDDVNTIKIGLKNLRGKISILPQEPILFPVSLRKNLDPMDEYDDSTLWSALQDVELNNVFTSLDFTLDQHNLSTGQCQLLCLARTILKKNQILVLDEATANVDTNTDSLIQKTIRAKFKDCTVLTIAHRLNTIIDCDKIMVIDHGKIVEYDHPKVLLKRTNGYFYKLARQSNIPVS